MEINKYISTHYNIRFVGAPVNPKDLSSVEEFLLCDNLGNPGYSKINSSFINAFSKKEDVVLVEGIPSMKQIEKEEATQSVWLKTAASILGWDLGSMGSIIGSKETQESEELTRRGQIMLRDLLDLSYTGDRKTLENELVASVETSLSLSPQLNQQSQFIVEKTLACFTERVQTMIGSLKTVKTQSSRTFLMAGGGYLLYDPKIPPKDARVSLSTFYEFLKDRNVVVLCPKSDIAKEIAMERTMLIFQTNKEVQGRGKIDFPSIMQARLEYNKKTSEALPMDHFKHLI